jgi:Zn-dependent peptidase ImmA (M78 family)
VAYLARTQIEARAAALWRRHALTPGFDAEILVETLGLNLLWERITEGLGERILGALRPEARIVLLNENRLSELERSVGLRRFTLGHEIAHWLLHAVDARAGTLPLDPTGRTWCRSGSAAQDERQAEMFAGSLLAPEDQIRTRIGSSFIGGWVEVYSLAKAFVVTPTAMVVRLDELGLAHLDQNGIPVPGRPRDARQRTLFG